jgi:hypothetical protein
MFIRAKLQLTVTAPILAIFMVMILLHERVPELPRYGDLNLTKIFPFLRYCCLQKLPESQVFLREHSA